MSKRLLPQKDKIIELYVDKKMTCKEICRKYGLSPNSSTNLSRKLREWGIEIRKDAGMYHHNWKGGKIIKGDNYIGIWMPAHKRADNQGYIYEHTLVYQQNTGYLPQKNEVIHHIDLDKHNNNFNNLYLCNHKQHAILHRSIESLIKPLLEKDIIYFDNGIYKLK